MHCKLPEGWLLAAGHLVAGGGGAAVEGGVLLGALQRGTLPDVDATQLHTNNCTPSKTRRSDVSSASPTDKRFAEVADAESTSRWTSER